MGAMGNGLQFGVDLQRFADETPKKMNQIYRKIMLDVFRGIIKKTPVKEGTARRNWQASIGAPLLTVIEGTDKSGGIAISGASKAISQAGEYTPVFLSNGLPYINRLEHGWSGQAPSGMVRITLAEYPGIVTNAVQEAGW